MRRSLGVTVIAEDIKGNRDGIIISKAEKILK